MPNFPFTPPRPPLAAAGNVRQRHQPTLGQILGQLRPPHGLPPYNSNVRGRGPLLPGAYDQSGNLIMSPTPPDARPPGAYKPGTDQLVYPAGGFFPRN